MYTFPSINQTPFSTLPVTFVCTLLLLPLPPSCALKTSGIAYIRLKLNIKPMFRARIRGSLYILSFYAFSERAEATSEEMKKIKKST